MVEGHVMENDRDRSSRLNFLTASQVEMIDEALAGIGDWGELRLVVKKGRLRFLVTQWSQDGLR